MTSDGVMLAGYISRYNIEFADREKAIETVVCAQEWLDNGELKGDKATQFFLAYSQLAGAIKPASVSSLRDSLDIRDPEGRLLRSSRARLACIRWSLFGAFILIGLVVLHTYWLAGRTLLDMKLVAGVSQVPPQEKVLPPATPAPVQKPAAEGAAST